MKRAVLTLALALAAAVVWAKSGNKAKAVAVDDDGVVSSKETAVRIERYPELGKQATMIGPSISGNSNLGQVYKRERRWIVLEAEYQTYAKALESLTFTWHVLLETKYATNKDREGQKKMAPYSYFTTTVTYRNIPRGSHAASVCLYPSYLECYGEPRAVGLVVTDKNGSEITGDTISQIKGIEKGTKFWDNDKIMNATAGNDIPMIQRRQGLLDRSKTIWALVNPNDYELVLQ